jgi:hypothetical protein
MKYRLSKILAAIEADPDQRDKSGKRSGATLTGAAESAGTVLRWLQHNPQKRWTDVLREWHWSLPRAVGMEAVSSEETEHAGLRRRIHDRLVEVAKKYGVPLEDC